MSQQVSVRRVNSKAEKKVFIEFPWTIYKDDPDWVPPLLSMRKDRLNPVKNPLLNHLDVEYFIAWRGLEPAGTIAAFINHRHNEFHHEKIGWFGFFEVLEDEEAALALLRTAEQWVQAKGYAAIRGPASFGDLDEFGLQVWGFGDPHVLLMPYNPEYYVRFIEAAGFNGIMDMTSWTIPREAVTMEAVNPKIKRVITRQQQRRNITLRLPDMKHLQQEVDLMMELYTGAWKDNWGFVPPTREEISALFDQLKLFFQPKLGRVAEIEGKPVGFVLLFPDLNQALKYARPHPRTPEIITLLRFLWHWKIRRKITRVRVPFLGVLEEYRGMGIDAMLYMAVADSTLELGYDTGDFGWILDDNEAMGQIADVIQGTLYKRFRMYEKPLGASAQA